MSAVNRDKLIRIFKNHETLKAMENALNNVLPEGVTGLLTLQELSVQRAIMSRLRDAIRGDHTI